MSSQNLHRLVSRKFLRASLIPILTIEVLLLALYFGVNSYISSATKASLLKQVNEALVPIAHQSADGVNGELRAISHLTDVVRNETVRWQLYPEKFVLPNGEPEFKISSNGAYYKANNQGCGLFYPGASGINDERRSQARLSEGLDPLYGEVLKSNSNLAAVYYNTHDNMNRLCPYIDKLWEQYPATLNMQDYNFFYDADAKHNPTRKVVWTSVYLDPAGQGWMTSAIAPVYRGDFLEGVVGLDVTVDKMTRNLLEQALPWSGAAFLVDSMGMILAMPAAVEKALGLSELKKHVYSKAVDGTVQKPENFNLTRNPDPQVASAFKQMLKDQGKVRHVILNGKGYTIAQSVISETGWRMMVIVEDEVVLAPITALEKLAQGLGYTVLGLMVVFYIVFFTVMYLQSKRFAIKVSEPVEILARAASQMGKGDEIQLSMDSGITELDQLSFEFARMQDEIRDRTEALIQEQVARSMQAKETELAYQVGLFESASAYLHNIGNALAGVDGYIRQLDRARQSGEQWPMAYASIRSALSTIGVSNDSEALRLLDRLEKVQMEGAMPLISENLQKIKKAQQGMLESIRFQQSMFGDQQKSIVAGFSQEFQMDDLVQEVLQEYGPQMDQLGVELIKNITASSLKGQRFQLKFGLANLVKNAIESIEQQKPELASIVVECKPIEKGVQVVIEDNGVGLDAEGLAKMGQSGFTRKKDGHGLGVHSLAVFLQSRGGELKVSSPGLGLGARIVMEIKNDA